MFVVRRIPAVVHEFRRHACSVTPLQILQRLPHESRQVGSLTNSQLSEQILDPLKCFAANSITFLGIGDAIELRHVDRSNTVHGRELFGEAFQAVLH